MFLDEWGKSNVAPIQKKRKKSDKNFLSSYWPVSLLLGCSKIFECLIHNQMYKHITDNNLLSPS